MLYVVWAEKKGGGRRQEKERKEEGGKVWGGGGLFLKNAACVTMATRKTSHGSPWRRPLHRAVSCCCPPFFLQCFLRLIVLQFSVN